MTEPEKSPSYYRSLPYTIEILPSSEGGFVAHHPALPGCAVEGDDVTSTLAALDEGRDLWIRAKLEAGEPIPEPADGEPSGRLMLRVPIRLHQQLEALARDYGRSLNRLTTELLLNSINALPPWYGLGERVSAGEAADARHHAYAFWLTPEPEGGYVAEHPDLPGCFAAGDDPEEAIEELQQARELWLEARQEMGVEEEPEPLSAKHSGMIHLRMPPELHTDLIREAKRNESSLNQMMTFLLAGAVGEMRAERRKQEPDREEGWWEKPAVAKGIESAVECLRQDPDLSDSNLPRELPCRATHFLRAIIHLEIGSPGQALECFGRAANSELDFNHEALGLFEKIPAPPSAHTLREAALKVAHSFREPAHGQQRFYLGRLTEFVGRVEEKEIEERHAREIREKQERRERRGRFLGLVA